MRTGSLLVAGLVISAVAASFAEANITLISDAREVFGFSRAVNANQTREDGPDQLFGTFGARFSDGVTTAITVSGAGASAAASQNSDFGPGLINILGSASASGTVSTGISSRGESRSTVELVIDVAGGSFIEILASTSGTGIFQLRAWSTNDIVFSGSGDFSRVAPAGGERFILIARANALVTPPPNGSSGGSFSVRFTAIPAPGPLALLAGGLLVGTRRRRA